MTAVTRATVGAFFRRDLAAAFSYRVPFLFDSLYALFTVATFLFVGKIVNPGEVPGGYLSFAVAGVCVAAFLSASLALVSGGIRQEQVQGTLEAVASTGLPARAMAWGYAAYPLAWATCVSALTLVIGAVFGARAPGANWGLVFVATAIAAIAFVGLGFIGAALVVVFRKGAPLVGWLLALMTLAAGELFPPSLLPEPLYRLSQLSPLTRALEIVREALFQGATWRSTIGDLLILALMAAIWVEIGIASLAWGFRRARQTGSLGGY